MNTSPLFITLLFASIVARPADAAMLGLHHLDADPTATTVGAFVTSGSGGETVYLSTMTGVWTVTDSSATFTETSHPTLGPPLSLTAPMKGPDGDIYVGATFIAADFFSLSGATFRVSEPGVVVQEWANAEIRSLDNEINAYGTFLATDAARFNEDGSTTVLDVPAGFGSGDALDSTSSGVAAGVNLRPGSLNGPSVWHASGISFISDTLDGRVLSVRDRVDSGQNFGAVLEGQAYVKFGDGELTALIDENSNPLLADEVYVAETDIAVINVTGGGVYVYFSGLSATVQQALPVESVFDELAATSYASAGRPTAVNGNLFLPLNGSVNLLVTLDPSVVPEPSISVLLVGMSLGILQLRRRA